ncbi:MAG: hypothetical protein QXK07_07130 [Desulfurococcaceae archaeon]
MSEILNDPRVKASLNRLTALGLKHATVPVDSETVAVVIDVESIINYIRKTVESKITYPNKHFIYDKDLLVFGVVLSKSSKKIAMLNDSELARALKLALDIGAKP